MRPSPALLIAAASTLDGLRHNAEGQWDIALVHHWGFWSHYDYASDCSSWPLPATHSAEALGALAERQGLLRNTASVGDVFLQYSPRQGVFVRGGIIAHIYEGAAPDADYIDALVIEGNSGKHGELGGERTQRIVRRLSASRGDRFIRWAGR